MTESRFADEDTLAHIAELEAENARLKEELSAAVLEAQGKQEPVAWPVMGYGQVAIGGGKQPNGMSALLYLEMGEAREIDTDTTDLFPVGSEAAPDKLMACVYFKDGAAMQQTIDVLREMQQEIGYAAPVVQPDMVLVPREPTEEMLIAGCKELGALYGHHGAKEAYCAMIAAAEGKK